jgi:hypothetical protein
MVQSLTIEFINDPPTIPQLGPLDLLPGQDLPSQHRDSVPRKVRDKCRDVEEGCRVEPVSRGEAGEPGGVVRGRGGAGEVEKVDCDGGEKG